MVRKNLAGQIAALHRQHQEWGATLIASALGCSDAYVRAVAKHKSLKLPRSPQGAVPTAGAKYMRDRRAANAGAVA